MMDNARALPSCPQRQQQHKTAVRKWVKITHTTSRRGIFSIKWGRLPNWIEGHERAGPINALEWRTRGSVLQHTAGPYIWHIAAQGQFGGLSVAGGSGKAGIEDGFGLRPKAGLAV